MTTPVIENIATNIVDAVNAITTANGFNQTLVAQRPKRLLFMNDAWDDLTVLVAQGNEDQGDELKGSYNVRELKQEFEIIAIVINGEKASIALDTRINQVDADIKKKLMESPKRGDYAIDTKLMDSERFAFNESFTGIIVNCEITYRVKSDDPYTQA